MNKKYHAELTFLAAIVIAACFTYLHATAEPDRGTEEYCEMVGIYLADVRAGVPEYERKGWPDYQGNYKEICK